MSNDASEPPIAPTEKSASSAVTSPTKEASTPATQNGNPVAAVAFIAVGTLSIAAAKAAPRIKTTWQTKVSPTLARIVKRKAKHQAMPALEAPAKTNQNLSEAILTTLSQDQNAVLASAAAQTEYIQALKALVLAAGIHREQGAATGSTPANSTDLLALKAGASALDAQHIADTLNAILDSPAAAVGNSTREELYALVAGKATSPQKAATPRRTSAPTIARITPTDIAHAIAFE